MSHLQSRDFYAQLYLAQNRKCDMACRATSQQSRNYSFRLEQRTILCNFVARMLWTLIGQCLFMRQAGSVRHGHVMSHLRFCCGIKLRKKIARKNCRCDICLMRIRLGLVMRHAAQPRPAVTLVNSVWIQWFRNRTRLSNIVPSLPVALVLLYKFNCSINLI